MLRELLAPQKPHPDREKIAEALKNAPPHKNPKVYKDEYDKNADEVIGLATFMPEHQFKQLPDIDASTALSMVKRMNEADRVNTEWMLKAQQLRPSMTKEYQTDLEWKPYIAIFDEYIKNGKTVGHARGLVGKLIEAENEDLLKNGEKLICVKKSKNGETKLRPSRKTLERQLVPKG